MSYRCFCGKLEALPSRMNHCRKSEAFIVMHLRHENLEMVIGLTLYLLSCSRYWLFEYSFLFLISACPNNNEMHSSIVKDLETAKCRCLNTFSTFYFVSIMLFIAC